MGLGSGWGGRRRGAAQLGVGVRGFEGADLGDPTDDGERGPEGGEVGVGDGASDDAAEGFAAAGATSASVVAVFESLAPDGIGVAWAVGRCELCIVLRALVGIANDGSDGCAECLVFEDAREKLDGVRLFAVGGEVRLAGAAAIECGLNLLGAQRNARGAAVNDCAHCGAMTFAKGGETKKLAEGVQGDPRSSTTTQRRRAVTA